MLPCAAKKSARNFRQRFSAYTSHMIREHLPAEVSVLHVQSVGLTITSRRLILTRDNDSQTRCFLEDIVLVQRERVDRPALRRWAKYLAALAVLIALLPRFYPLPADTVRVGLPVAAIASAVLFMLWFLTRTAALRFGTAAGSVEILLTGDSIHLADEIVSAYETARANVACVVHSTGSGPPSSASAP